MARGECTVCRVGFPVEDLVDVDGSPCCPRCFALTSTTERPASVEPDAAGRSSPSRPELTTESLEALAAAGGGDAPTADHGPGRASGGPDDGNGESGRGFDRLAAPIREWAAGRNWWVRAPVLLWMAWILGHYWNAPWYSTVFRGIDLAIHEIGHILWAPLGEFMGFAGGTLTQLLAPVVAGFAFFRQRDWFAVSFAVCWLGINCFEIVEYAGDALARQLPLVSPTSGSPRHDWSYMLAELGILRHTDAVAAAWQWAGRVIMAVGIGFGAWVLWEMMRSQGQEKANDR